MGYSFEPGESVNEAVKRVAGEQLDQVLQSLGTVDHPDAVNIHEARKRLKMLRAVARLVRDDLDPSTADRVTGTCRDIGRRLAPARDADVLLATFDRIVPPGIGSPNGTYAARQLLVNQKERLKEALLEADWTSVVHALRSERDKLEDWTLRHGGWRSVKDGLVRGYKRGRAALKAARVSPTTEQLHEWRKRAKDLWYHVRLLKKAWPPVLDAMIDESHALTEALGDDHDYAILSSTLAGGTLVVDPRLGTSLVLRVNGQRAELQQTAWTLGQRIYADRPRSFRRRMHDYWDSWRDE